MEKKYWIKINNSENGPFSFNELLNYDLEPETPFWYVGLEKWIAFNNSNLFLNYNEEKKKRKKIEIEKIAKLKRLKKKVKIVSFVLLPLLMIISFLYYQYKKNDFFSKALEDNNLRSRVKLITSNDFGNAAVRNIEYYDITGNLKFYSTVSFSISSKLGEKGTSNLIINNFIVVETILDSVTNSYITQKLAQINNYTHLTSQINLRNSNEAFNSIENISETKNIELWIVDENGNKVQKRIYNEKGQLQSYPESYCLNKDQNKILTINCDKNNQSYIGDTLRIDFLDNNKNKIEEISYFSSDKSNRIKRIYQSNILLKDEIYDKDGEKWSFTNYVNDIFGNKISEDKFTDITKTKYKDIFDDYLTSNKESHIKYEYTYDNRDNWIEFSGYENDKELFHTNRKIEYYSFWEFLKNYFE